jgi:hypothetical protein
MTVTASGLVRRSPGKGTWSRQAKNTAAPSVAASMLVAPAGALRPERAQDGDDAPPAATRDRARGPPAARAPGMGAGQVGEGGAPVEEHQALRRESGRLGLPLGPCVGELGLVLLGGAQAVLFCA